MAEQSKGSFGGAAQATPTPGIVVKRIDVGEKMRGDAIPPPISCLIFRWSRVGDGFEKHTVAKEVAEFIKKEFDKKHGQK
ncbi:hypothetical protein ZIOFF_064046 [Zingiber officinale]|uniref:Uncharacterized protein n=1 Tax=Zingiber officinale TaxID=94328 RepID=A0A8J5EV47_ZINOF|nr:hypothetical protein ZIOFF_064046 [Zingiber officinale]